MTVESLSTRPIYNCRPADDLSHFIYQPTSIWRRRWGDPLEFRRDLWHQKTRIHVLSCDVVRVVLRLAVWYSAGL